MTKVTDQLRAALNSRTLIDQTIGIIMGQNRCNADAAFAVLRSASQNRNVKLRDVAAEIITRGDHHHREHATAAAGPRVRGVIRAEPDGRPATRRCRQRWALSTDMRHGLSSVVRDCRNRSMEGIDMSF